MMKLVAELVQFTAANAGLLQLNYCQLLCQMSSVFVLIITVKITVMCILGLLEADPNCVRFIEKCLPEAFSKVRLSSCYEDFIE